MIEIFHTMVVASGYTCAGAVPDTGDSAVNKGVLMELLARWKKT